MPIPIILLDSGAPGTVIIVVNLTRKPVIRCPSPKAKRQTSRSPTWNASVPENLYKGRFSPTLLFYSFTIILPSFNTRLQTRRSIFEGMNGPQAHEMFSSAVTSPYVEKRRYICLRRADETRAFGLESTLCRTDSIL